MEHFEILMNSVKEVGKDFLCMAGNGLDKKFKKKHSDLVERVFAYELYRVWQNNLDKRGIKDVRVMGEMFKHFTQKIIEKGACYCAPDLVLHSTKSESSDKNLIILEIKKEYNKKSLPKDVKKICRLMSSDEDSLERNDGLSWCPFKIGVILLLVDSMPKEDEISLSTFGLDETIKEQAKGKEIYCILYDGEEPKPFLLSELKARQNIIK